MSARWLVFLAVLAATAGLALRMPPAAGAGAVLPPPPAHTAHAALRPAAVDATTGPRLQPLEFLAPLDPALTPRSSIDATAIRLTGIVSDGRRALALLVGPDGAPQTLAPGEDISGWTVVRIGTRNVLLRRRNEVVEKGLYLAPATTVSPAGAYRGPEPPSGGAQQRTGAQEPASAPTMPYLPPPGRQ